MGFPAALEITNAADEDELQQLLEDLVQSAKELPGGQSRSELTIASGSVTATRSIHSLDTESDAATDDLTNILTTGLKDGHLLLVRVENAGRVVTVKASAGGAGQMTLAGTRDVVLDATTKFVLFYVDLSSTAVLLEVGRFGFAPLAASTQVALAAGATTLTAADSGKTFSNDGAGAQSDVTLPTAVAGLRFEFVTLEAFIVQVTAAAGDTIRDAGTVSVSGGEIQSTAAKGNAIEIECFNADEWVLKSKQGSWTVT